MDEIFSSTLCKRAHMIAEAIQFLITTEKLSHLITKKRESLKLSSVDVLRVHCHCNHDLHDHGNYNWPTKKHWNRMHLKHKVPHKVRYLSKKYNVAYHSDDNRCSNEENKHRERRFCEDDFFQNIAKCCICLLSWGQHMSVSMTFWPK